MKNAFYRHAGLRSKKGQNLLEVVIYMVIAAVIALAGTVGYQIYLQDANGSACNTNLNQLDVADKSYVMTQNLTSASGTSVLPSYTTPPAAFTAFLGGRTINGTGTSNISCPASGTYSGPTAWLATGDPGNPTCSLAVAGGTFTGTRFHSIAIIAN